MTMTLADGDGLGGGFDSLDLSDVIGLFSVDQGIDALDDIVEKSRDCPCLVDLGE